MKLLSILLTAILCATASAQTIKTLGYNSTNGQVVANTGTNVSLTFTNENMVFQKSLTFQDDVSGLAFEASAGTNSTRFDESGISFGGSALTNTRANLGFSTNLNALWTATNASNARSAIGFGVTNSATFKTIKTDSLETFTNVVEVYVPLWIGDAGTNDVFQFEAGAADQAKARTNLGLPLATLTNDSNVKMMRALAGSTNTNEPYSGTVSLTNTNVLTFSNGVLLRIQ